MSAEHASQNLFEIDGFKTGVTELPSLHLILDLSPNCYFRYDDPVPDLRSYAWSLGDRLYPEEEIILGIGAPLLAHGCAGFNKVYYLTKDRSVRGSLMAVKDVSPRLNTSTEAHEAAEVAFCLGFIQELEGHFRALGFNLALAKFSQSEIGIIGGAIGALIHGYNHLVEKDFQVLNGIEDEYGLIIDRVLASRTKNVYFPQKI